MAKRPDDNARYLAEESLKLLNEKEAEAELEKRKAEENVEKWSAYLENLKRDRSRVEEVLER